MKRAPIIFEAILVGLINLLMFVIIRALTASMKLHLFTQLVLTGIAVHLFFEYSPFGNLNESWCRATFPAASKSKN